MTDEEEIREFDLSVTIDDEELVEWLEELDDENLAEQVQSTLRAGHFMLNLVQAAAGEEQMEKFFRPVTEQMEDLQETLETIIRSSQKSQRIGEIGEEIVAKQLKDAFPADSFDVVSKSGHEADIRAMFDLGTGDSYEARIEVKLYSGDVPSKELDKFRRDLESTGVRYGLMVSLASRLTGMKGSVQVEETADYTAVYLSNSGLDGVNLVSAAAMLKAIMMYRARADRAERIQSSAIEQAWKRLSSEIEELEHIARDVEDFREKVLDAEKTVVGQMRDLADAANRADIRLQHAVGRITNRLSEELNALPAQGTPQLPAPSDEDEVLALLDQMDKAKDKRSKSFMGIYKIVQKHGLNVTLAEDGHFIITDRKKEIARTGGTKTRVDVFISVDEGQSIEIKPGIESIKKGNLCIDGKDVDAMLKRFKKHVKAGRD